MAGIKDWLIEGRGWADLRLLREMTTFVYNKQGKPEAKVGAHDDEVMALGVALQVDILAPYENYVEEQKVRENGLPESFYEPLKQVTVHEPTSHELCLATIARQKQVHDGMAEGL